MGSVNSFLCHLVSNNRRTPTLSIMQKLVLLVFAALVAVSFAASVSNQQVQGPMDCWTCYQKAKAAIEECQQNKIQECIEDIVADLPACRDCICTFVKIPGICDQ